ncbi:hypothetical protein A7K91_00095 [Paenibacillus oryzae]|uniref:Uncharacterized protein n=1 Tax=Paenibacillus oryzae TaxID=1844972 RepID=A0A1A5YM63_9BACL|nr:hypothetical protein [Paenibacillus oryzae]OBR66719.1 hypothetical protein A7K91_00095 [Paenibacillus oryzae]
MRKSVVVLITVIMMLAGCSGGNQEEYITEIKSVNEGVLKAIDLTERALRNLDDKNEFESVMKGICTLMQKQVDKVESLTPPKKFKSEHEHYIAFTLRMYDSSVALLKGDNDVYEQSLLKAEQEYKLANKLTSKFDEN